MFPDDAVGSHHHPVILLPKIFNSVSSRLYSSVIQIVEHSI